MEIRTLNSIDHFKRTIDRRFFYPVPGSKIVLCTDRDFENAWWLFIFLLGLFSLRSHYLWAWHRQKVFWEHPHHWHKAKICKSIERNFYLFFIQSLIDMTQMFNIIYRWPSFGGPQNTLGLRISWETSAIFSPVPGWSFLPRCPRKVWEKAGERVSWWCHISRASNALVWGWAIFCWSVSIVVAVVGAAIVGDVCSPIEGELSPKVD